jgi:hypothetical protein
MIDGIKFRLNPDAIASCDVLEFHRKDDKRQTAKYRGITVELYPDACNVRGSLHKYRNDGVHNADDFKLSEFVQTVNDLAATLNFNPETTRFYSLEFGVNINLSFDARKFINSIIYYNNGTVTNDELGVKIGFFDHEVKIYLKGTKVPEIKENSLLRYEIGINRTRRIKKIIEGENVFCSTLSDLANPAVWNLLKRELLSVYDSLLIVERDKVDIQSLNTDETRLFVNGCNPGYWTGRWDNRAKKKREIEKFRDMITRHSTSTMKNDVRRLIEEKINALIDMKDVTFAPFGKHENLLRLHHLGSQKMDVKESEKCYVCTTWITGANVTNPTPQKRLCKVTGLSLEIGIKQGEYLSAKGVEFYYNNYPEIYQKKLAIRLSEKWKSAPLKIQFSEISHSIRNEIYNPKNNPRNNFKRYKNRLTGKGGLLFGLDETIRPDKKKYLQI